MEGRNFTETMLHDRSSCRRHKSLAVVIISQSTVPDFLLKAVLTSDSQISLIQKLVSAQDARASTGETNASLPTPSPTHSPDTVPKVPMLRIRIHQWLVFRIKRKDPANENASPGHSCSNALSKSTCVVSKKCCDKCGGRMKLVGVVFDQPTITTTLRALGLPVRAPPIAPARSRQLLDCDNSNDGREQMSTTAGRTNEGPPFSGWVEIWASYTSKRQTRAQGQTTANAQVGL
ncbi:MAG: hypothetical protein RL189_2438 [Pseudomonadota bacterium]